VPPASSTGYTPSLSLLDASPLSPWGTPGAAPLLASRSSEEPSPAQARHAERQRDRLDSVGTHVYLLYYALTRGFVHAALLDGMPDSRKVPKELLLLGPLIGETVAAVLLASSEGMTPGRAHVIGTGLDFGLIAGVMVAGLAGANYGLESGTEGYLTVLPPLSLSLAGAVVGALLVDAQHLTWGDMEFVHMSGLVGAFAGGAAVSSLEWGEVGVLLGSAGGLLLGGVLVRGRDFSVGQSLAMDMSALAGGIAGTLGASRLGAGDEVSAMVGGAFAAVGLSLSYLLLAPSAVPAEKEFPVKLSLQLVPGALSARDTRKDRPTSVSLLLQGRF
jgi:hypothetical protein